MIFVLLGRYEQSERLSPPSCGPERNELPLSYLPFARTGSRDGSYILRMTKSRPGSDHLTLFCYVREKYTSEGFKPLYFSISIAAWTVHCRVPLAFTAGLVFHSVCRFSFPELLCLLSSSTCLLTEPHIILSVSTDLLIFRMRVLLYRFPIQFWSNTSPDCHTHV